LLTGAGAVEDDVYHHPAPQVFGGDFAHHPAHRVDDVGFTAAVRANYADAVAGKGDAGGVNEGFEAVEFDFAQAHGYWRFDERGSLGELGNFRKLIACTLHCLLWFIRHFLGVE